MTRKREKVAKPTIDPELQRQLAAAASEDNPEQAVFTLTPPGESFRSKQSTNEVVIQIVDEAASACNSAPHRVKVFPKVQSFAVSGSAALVRSRLKQQENASAMANVRKEDLLIRSGPSKVSNKKKVQHHVRVSVTRTDHSKMESPESSFSFHGESIGEAKRTLLMNRNYFTLLSAFALLCGLARADDLTCLSENDRASATLYSHLRREAYAALDRRDQTYEQLKTPEQIREYQQRLRGFFIQQLGGFPDRTPLNARTVRIIKADGYRIELVIYESQPRHHVTANLYIPDGDGPFPGVVVSSGHSRTAKTADYNQRFGIMMAKHGMAALCFDPIGQGERSQILDDQGNPMHSGTTTEHFLIGVGSTLVGRNTATYHVWDGIRSIDYLVSRPEIDPARIGYTGCSGGGTLTSYVMALDDRVTCAAPACYLTTFRKLIETIGPQDAEQNIFGQIAFGLDHPDYILMRAPRPTLICATTGDYFDIVGAWDNYRQAKRVYGQLGYPERVDLVEMDGPHGVKPQGLATIAHWMQRWLLDRDEAVSIAELATRPPEDLHCTPAGQVLRLPDERSVFDLNAEREEQLAAQRKGLWENESRETMVSKIRERAGVRSSEELKPPKFEDVGRIQRDEYHIDRLILRTDSGVPLPGLTFHPKSPQDDAYLYLHDNGKLGDSEPDGSIEQLVSDGYAVVSIDLCGQGETASGKRDELLTDWKTYYLAYLLGKPLLGLRVEDALAGGHFVAYYQKPADKPRHVHLVGVGQAGIIALHAAALRPELFASVTLRDTPRDWSSVVKLSTPQGQLDSAVHGALEVYDLPDLVRLVGEDKVRFE